MPLEQAALTAPIIASAIEVHSELGPGFLESLYEKALTLELQQRGIPFQSQVSVPVIYKTIQVGLHRIDLMVFDEIIVELKTVTSLKDIHFATVRSYLRALNREHGLILNFAKTTLEIRRVRARRPTQHPPSDGQQPTSKLGSIVETMEDFPECLNTF